MIKKNVVLGLLLLFSVISHAKVEPEAKHDAQIRLLNAFLTSHHYQSAALDDEKSKEILHKYIDYLDYGKFLFTKQDVSYFERYQTILDDMVRKGDLSAVFQMYDIALERRTAQFEWMIKRLQSPFSEESQETFQFDRDKVSWANSDDELKQRWEKKITNEWITFRLSKQSNEKAIDVLTKRYKNRLKRIKKAKSDDIFQLFANAVTSVYDPHTSYFSPRTGENFDINMSLSLEGIGAQLSLEDEIITITELIAGGPAIKSGKLSANDKILGVAQGFDGDIVDVVGWRLDEAVELIRGKRGTIVRLQIQKGNSDEIVEITLTRDKIKLEESAAKSKIKSFEQDGKVYKIGVIELPSFYIDFAAANKGEKDYRSTTRDVKKLIQQLEKEKIDGLVIDLRNNGGGSLVEAVSLTGLFIDTGPVVQVHRLGARPEVHADEDDEITYMGPLGVIINENSASASEIFAGAIKDYGRGVILGSPTYGKGTVQSIVDLSRFLPGIKDKVGQLKMTIAMFYRINGSSTQLKGVVPDIYIPNKENSAEGGEREQEHALDWKKIGELQHQKFGFVGKQVLERLQQDYDSFTSESPLFKNLVDLLKWQKIEEDNTIVSLSLKKRLKEKQRLRDKGLQFQNANRKIYGYPLLSADYLDKEYKDKSQEEKDNDKKYEVDAILDLATKTMADYVTILSSK
ncbi:MAG: carboxy terminal-processing peptidase [Gammaproteobacteria bacterium]|nr:carboxy terminal-processing peptidase [Gammaproteobacteria bacterium]